MYTDNDLSFMEFSDLNSVKGSYPKEVETMKNYTKWAGREYTLKQRLLGLIPAFFLFVLIIPYLLVIALPRLDAVLHLPNLYFGIVNIIMWMPFYDHQVRSMPFGR